MVSVWIRFCGLLLIVVEIEIDAVLLFSSSLFEIEIRNGSCAVGLDLVKFTHNWTIYASLELLGRKFGEKYQQWKIREESSTS